MLEDGRDRGAGHARELLEESLAVPRDRREGPARPGVPEPRRSRARGGGPVMRRWLRALRGEERRVRKLRHLLALLRPYRRRVALMLLALLVATGAALVPPYLAGRAIDEGVERRRHRRAHHDRRPVHPRRPRQLGRHVLPDLPDQLGRPARAPGPAPADLRAPAAAVDRLLLAQQGGRADLADDERRAGARPARDRGHRDAVLRHADAARHGRDPGRARPRPRARHLPHLPRAARGQRDRSGSPRAAPTG